MVKKSSTGHASVLQIFLLYTLKKILGTWRIPTCNKSSSKKSSLPVIIQLINQFVFSDFSEEIECALVMFTNITTLTKAKYTLSILQIYWKYTSKEYLKHTSNILQVYLKYTSSIFQPDELQKKKYTSILYYFDKRSTFEAHFVKLNQHFNVNLKYASSIL